MWFIMVNELVGLTTTPKMVVAEPGFENAFRINEETNQTLIKNIVENPADYYFTESGDLYLRPNHLLQVNPPPKIETKDIAAKAISENKVVGNTDTVSTNAVVWTDVPDMTLTYNAEDTGALMIMSGCGTGGGSFVLSRHGELRMLVDGVEVAKEGPSAILLGAFMQIITVTEPKEYEIKLQWRADREEPSEVWSLSTKNRGIFLIHIKR